MRLLYRSVIVLFTVLLFSCAQLQFSEFTIESCDFVENTVKITFSAEPNQYTFIKAFSLKEDTSDTTGTFSFDANTVTYYPNNGIKANYLYNLSITTDAEDREGNSLRRKYEKTYTTRENFDRPSIIKITPANESNITSQVNEIVFEFSKPIDVDSFKSAFSISPYVTYIVTSENNDKTVKVQPIDLLKKNSRYNITVSKKLADKNRNFLLNDFKSTFINFDDKKIPEYSFYWNDGVNDNFILEQSVNTKIPNDVKLILDFDEEIDINYIISYIEIEPSISVTVTPDKISKKTATIEFSNNIIWNQEYTIKILKGIKDLCGNEIKDDHKYKIVFNNEKNRPVTLEKVFINLLNGNTTFDEIKNFTTLTFDTANFPTTNIKTDTNIYAIFNISEDAACISELSVMNAFNITYTNSCLNSITVKTVNVMTEAQVNNNNQLKNAYDSITITEGKLCVVNIGIEIINSGNANTGVLTINFDKGIKDNLGNIMPKNCEYNINKQ